MVSGGFVFFVRVSGMRDPVASGFRVNRPRSVTLGEKWRALPARFRRRHEQRRGSIGPGTSDQRFAVTDETPPLPRGEWEVECLKATAHNRRSEALSAARDAYHD